MKATSVAGEFGAALLCASLSAWSVEVPDTGRTIQELRTPEPPGRTAPSIRVEEPKAGPILPADGPRIAVKALRITGQSRFSEAELLALTGFVPGSLLSLSELRQMASRIQAHYRNNGYFLSRAYVPAQESREGTITISVIEAKYGKIEARNRSSLSGTAVESALRRIQRGDVIASGALERSVLLLGDLAGVGGVKAALSPGADLGASDLVVEVEPGRKVSGSLDFDTYGNRFTGASRLGGSISIHNPTGRGDLLSARAMSSFRGIDSGRAAYQVPFMDAQAGISYSVVNYTVGSDLASLGAHGRAAITSVNGAYPFIRSQNTNLYGQLSYDDKKLQDRIDSTSTNTDKKATAWVLGVNGERRDGMGGGGLNSFGLNYTSGRLSILTPAALLTDALTARTQGGYGKTGYHAARLQSLGEATTLYASLAGQRASKNLDSSEKFILGGARGVRAYPQGEAPGDDGHVVNLELRRQLSKSDSVPGEFQVAVFIDVGRVTTNHNTWAAATGPNTRSLRGAGIGLNWSKKSDFAVKLDLAWKIGAEKATADTDRGGRAWLQALKYF